LSLATFFAACRYLTQDMKGVFFRVSVRTDVWALIRRYDEALDKTGQYVSEILWGQEDFLALLSLRIRANAINLGVRLPVRGRNESAKGYKERLLSTAFVPSMQWGDSRQESTMQPSLSAPRMVRTYRVIYTLSYERPRWAIQLCKLAREAALRKNSRRITKDSIDEVWGEYGAKRIEDLVAEHKHQCAQVNELLNAFRGALRLMSRQELFKWIKNRVSEHLELKIEGTRTRSPREIARFLYRIGFIVARSENDDGQYEHYRFDQMSDFLLARTDDDFSVKWEIHPCYRQALDIKKLNQSHRERFVRQRRGER
ncbi:MAG: P-loop ATPase, Sll1717 family, partial [Candidatus Sulfotelmatobacter sp.]